MAATTNIYGFNVGGNNNSFDQRGHFYRAFLSGNVSGMVVKQNSTPNMTVLVEHGSALLNKNTISASVAEIKADTSVAIDTADTANPRIDSIVIYEDTSVAIPTVEANYWQDGAGGRFKLVSIKGTAAASPTALSDSNIQSGIGAGKPFTRLADITVPANSTTILNSNIADKRVKIQTPITGLNGGTTAGVLTTDASGNVASSGVTTYTNTGSAGGTFKYTNHGGMKILWGKTNPVTGSNATINIPAGVFTTLDSVVATENGLYTNTNQVSGHIEAQSTTQIIVSNIILSGSNPSNPISIIAIGT